MAFLLLIPDIKFKGKIAKAKKQGFAVVKQYPEGGHGPVKTITLALI
jgi:hypothetical protein